MAPRDGIEPPQATFVASPPDPLDGVKLVADVGIEPTDFKDMSLVRHLFSISA